MNKSLNIVLILVVLSAILLSACGGSEEPAVQVGAADRPTPPAEYDGKKNPKAGDAAAVQAGKSTYEIYCASCHGQTGKGDGPAASSLDPSPQDLAHNQKDLSDSYLLWRISEGGMQEPFKSAMPAWKEALSESQIWEIVAYLRTLAE